MGVLLLHDKQYTPDLKPSEYPLSNGSSRLRKNTVVFLNEQSRLGAHPDARSIDKSKQKSLDIHKSLQAHPARSSNLNGLYKKSK